MIATVTAQGDQNAEHQDYCNRSRAGHDVSMGWDTDHRSGYLYVYGIAL